MKKKIVILGSSGYLGSYLCWYFLKKKKKIISISRRKPNISSNRLFHINTNFSQKNIPKKIILNLKNSDVIICIGNSNPRFEKYNLNSKSLILKKLLKYSDNTRWILISSGGTVYGKLSKPASELNQTKAYSLYAKENISSEELLINNSKKYNYNYIICRLSNLYGKSFREKKNQGIINILIQNSLDNVETKIFTKLTTIRDYIYIGDAATAIDLIVKSSLRNEILNISSGVGTTLNNLFKKIKKTLKIDFKIKLLKKKINLDFKFSVLKNDKAKKLLGWKPKTNLKKGLILTLDKLQN